MRFEFNLDRDTGLPHCYKHRVSEAEAIDVISNALEYLQRNDGSLVAHGFTSIGRCLEVIYREFPQVDLIFVITAYDLTGAGRRAFFRRIRR